MANGRCASTGRAPREGSPRCRNCTCTDRGSEAAADAQASTEPAAPALPLTASPNGSTAAAEGSDKPKRKLWGVTPASQSGVDVASDGAAAMSTPPVSTPPAQADCGARAVCCRELKAADESAAASALDPDLVRDLIIGLSDGLTVPFALTAGLSGTNSARLVVIAGLAELVSGAISMGVGGFLSAQSEVQRYTRAVARTRARIAHTCEAQIAREVHEILGPYGVPQSEAARVASVLRRAELEEGQGSQKHRADAAELEAQDARAAAAQDAYAHTPRRFAALAHLPVLGTLLARDGAHDRAARTHSNGYADDEKSDAASAITAKGGRNEGLSVFLLRVGEGVEPVATQRMYISAVVIGLSYFLGGLVPLIPYFCTTHVYTALYISIGVTSAVLLLFGVAKTAAAGALPVEHDADDASVRAGKSSRAARARAYAFGAVSTLAVGAAAAAASFGIVRALEGDKSIG